MTLADIKSAITGLSDEDRAELAAWLLGSLDGIDEQEAEGLWNQESKRRLEEFRAGRAKTIAAEDVAKKAADLFR